MWLQRSSNARGTEPAIAPEPAGSVWDGLPTVPDAHLVIHAARAASLVVPVEAQQAA
jgi:hypothetical protein